MTAASCAAVMAASLGVAASAQAGQAPTPTTRTTPHAAVSIPQASSALALPATASQLVEGRVLNPDGKAKAGKDIYLLAWPANEVSAPKVGTTGTLTVLKRVKTDTSGSYRFDVPGAELGRFADRWGNVNLSVHATDLSVQPAVSLRTTRAVGSAVGGTRGTMIAHERGSVTETSTLRVPDVVAMAPGKGSKTITAAAAAAVPDGAVTNSTCGTVLIQDYGITRVLVGQRYVSTSGVKSDFTYSSGASTTFGVGYSASGAFGSFRQSGTQTRSSTATIDFPVASNWRRDWTYFRWGKYRIRCYIEGSSYNTWYEARTTSFAGGAYADSASAPASRYCVPAPNGYAFTKDTSDAVTWSAGADTSGKFGIDLSTNTGYETSAAVKFTFSATRRLCGSDGYPGGVPRRLVADL